MKRIILIVLAGLLMSGSAEQHLLIETNNLNYV